MPMLIKMEGVEQSSPPPARIPISLETEPEKVGMEEPETPDLDSLKDDMHDLGLPELAVIGSENKNA